MSARDDLIDEYGHATCTPLGTLDQFRASLDALVAETRAEVLAQVGTHLAEIYGIDTEPLGVNIGEWLQRGALWEE